MKSVSVIRPTGTNVQIFRKKKYKKSVWMKTQTEILTKISAVNININLDDVPL